MSMIDPLADSPWSDPNTVAGFVRSLPNETLMQFAADEWRRATGGRAVDIGCGAGRNAIPLARLGYLVLGTDLSFAMLKALTDRRSREPDAGSGRVLPALTPMDLIPAADKTCDLVVAHGIWNLAQSDAEFRRAVREAARVAKPGAGLFVFTFSRHMLPDEAAPVPGEAFAFTQFSGRPQCFLTERQLLDELAEAGFAPDAAVPLREHNRPAEAVVRVVSVPVLYEGAFRRL